MFEDVASEDTAGFLCAVGEALAKLPSELWRTGNEGFGAIVAAMDAVGVQLECARVGLVAEAESREVVDQSSSPSAAAWLMEHSLHLEPADASRAVDLARACAQPPNQAMAAAVAGGTLTVRKGVRRAAPAAPGRETLAGAPPGRSGGRARVAGGLVQRPRSRAVMVMNG